MTNKLTSCNLCAALVTLVASTAFAQGPITVTHDFGIGNLLGGLVQTPDGTFYGVLGDDGNNFPPPPGSSIFHLNGTSVTTVFTFPSDGSQGLNPNALVQASDGNLYGTTSAGGTGGHGVIFRLSRLSGYQIIHQFTGNDGASPTGRLLQGTDGMLYGATVSGGASGQGTLFRISLSSAFQSLHSFLGTDGAAPNGDLIQIFNELYGSTLVGGSNGLGTLFRFTPGGSVVTIHNFALDGCPNPVTLGPNGILYGSTADVLISATESCFTNNVGSIFSLDLETGSFQRLYSFASNSDGAAFPSGPLLAASDGNLYGVTEIGGPSEFSVGTFFSFNPGTDIISTADFLGGSSGGSPCCELVQSEVGPVLGVTEGFTSIEGNSPDSVVFSAAPGLSAPEPSLAGFAPSSGPSGTTVVVYGNHFLGTSAVRFNGTSAAFRVTSTNAIVTVVPVGATSGKITVTNSAGSANSAFPFTAN